MELLYIYILNYRNTFVKQEFNFSTQWRFHYEESQQALNVAENPLYLERFFELPDRMEEEGKVVNVTGVIGKNGAGKTTVLDFIKENLVEGAGVVESPAIIVVKQGRDKRVYTHTSLSVLHGNFRDYGYKVTPYDNQQNPLRTPLPNTSVVFFSNIFDAKRESEWTGMRNISTNFLVVDAKLRALEMKRVDPTFSETVYYRREEILKQLLLIRRNEENEFHLPIEMPDRVMVIPNSVATRVEELPSGNKKLTPEMEKFHYLQTQVFHWLVEMKLNAKGLDSIKLTYFIAAVNTFLYEMATFYSYVLSDGFLNLRNTYAKNIDPQQSAYEKVRAFIQKVQDSFTKEKEPDHVMDRVQSLQRFLQVLDAGITEDSVVDGSHFALLTSPPEGRVDILSFLDAYTRAIHFLPFLEFEWRNLSSGQKALLATYARFYSIGDEVERAANMRLEDQVLILIDEGELYLHPEWQRGFWTKCWLGGVHITGTSTGIYGTESKT